MANNLIIYTDGGARGNPGPAAIGVFIVDDKGLEITRFGKTIGLATNNVAEYIAVISALEWIKQSQEARIKNKELKIENIKFFLDSKLVVNQLNGIFKIKEAHLRELIIKIRQLERGVGVNIFYVHIPREKNKIADGLVNDSFSK